jgi:hypothetical protein
MRYIATPKEISLTEILSSGFSLSPSQYKKVILPNPNYIFVKDFLSRELKFTDLGNEVGSINYIWRSPYFFMRTKALQSHSYIPDITPESTIPVMPKAFSQKNLKKDDVIISKDSNIGEVVILDKDYPNIMLSGALYKLPIKQWKYYLLAFLKHDFFREQLDFMVPKSATIRHAKTIFCDCKIPLPQTNQDEVIEYVEVLTKSLIEKQKAIRQKHKQIHQLIENELLENQLPKEFRYEFPSLEEVKEVGRFDTNLFTPNFKKKEYLLKNYSNGFTDIFSLNFEISRGQNLQVANIGESVYSNNFFLGFYALMLPKHLSKYGTIMKSEFLGNKKELKTLKKGDIIFGAEGFDKGRSIVILEDKSKTITNIHGITLHHLCGNIQLSIFVKCFLDYLRNEGMIDLYAVGGNGGSLAQKYWSVIPFPNFPETKQKEITELYHNPAISLSTELTLENFLTNDSIFNEQAGILELDKIEKQLKARLDEVLDQIVNDVEVEIDFKFLNN